MIRNFLTASRMFLQTFWRVTRRLFHEVTGAAFGVFALYGAEAAWWGHSRKQGVWAEALALSYGAMMAIFSMLSFRSARRVR